MPRFRSIPAGALTAGLILAALTGCTARTAIPAKETATIVDTVAVRAASPGTITFDGVLKPRREIALGFRIGGRIVAVTAQVGDHVHAGQVIARLSRDEAVAASGQARAELVAVTAEAERARDAAARADGLDGVGALSTGDVRDRALTAAAAAARREAARSALDRARVGLGDAVLVATEDGVVTDRLAEPGTVVTAGAPVLRLAAGGADIEVRVNEAARLSPGAMADAAFWSAPTVDAQTRLRWIGPAGDSATRLRTARFTVLGDVSGVPFNSSATVMLRVSTPRSVSRVPLTAIGAQGGQPHVWSLAAREGRVHRQRVRIVALRGDDALVTGLADGQRVVASGIDALTEGQAVVMAGTEQVAG